MVLAFLKSMLSIPYIYKYLVCSKGHVDNKQGFKFISSYV